MNVGYSSFGGNVSHHIGQMLIPFDTILASLPCCESVILIYVNLSFCLNYVAAVMDGLCCCVCLLIDLFLVRLTCVATAY